VLDLNVTEAVESLLGAVSRKHTEGIKESKRRLGTKLVLEGTKRGGGLAGLGRGKGGSAGNEGGNDGRLHSDCIEMRRIEFVSTFNFHFPFAASFNIARVFIC
jgi:hypothetical protein